MEVNNFDYIKDLLDFSSNDDFYFLQILKRKKENPEVPSNHNNNKRAIRTYYISSNKYFNDIEEEVKLICKATNSRAYIHLSKRSFKKTGLQCFQEMTTCLVNNNYQGMYRCFNSACGKSESITSEKYWLKDYDYSVNKLWIVDIDKEILDNLNIYKRLIENCSDLKQCIISTIPTKSGKHLITKPFNSEKFFQDCIIDKIEIPDIQKNNPTLLYYSDEN